MLGENFTNFSPAVIFENAVKSTLSLSLQVCELFPHLADRKEYLEVGTPLSNMFYLGSSRGEVYGVDHNTVRFSASTIADLRPEIGVPGLYLTGQDVLTCGFAGAMTGGLLCASAILRRNLVADLMKLKEKTNKKED